MITLSGTPCTRTTSQPPSDILRSSRKDLIPPNNPSARTEYELRETSRRRTRADRIRVSSSRLPWESRYAPSTKPAVIMIQLSCCASMSRDASRSARVRGCGWVRGSRSSRWSVGHSQTFCGKGGEGRFWFLAFCWFRGAEIERTEDGGGDQSAAGVLAGHEGDALPPVLDLTPRPLLRFREIGSPCRPASRRVP